MGSLLYFIPNVVWIIPDRAALLAAGLDGVLGGAAVSAAPSEGPGAANGMFLALGSEPAVYRPAAQTWTLRQDGRAWLGFERTAPPGPDDLARPEQLPGHLVRLANGADWLVPAVRLCPDGRPGVPQTWFLEPGGVRKEVSPAFADLWADCGRLWAAELALEDADRVRIVHRALGLNYRLATDEINALKLLNEAAIAGVIAALLDFPTWEVAAAVAAARSEK